MTSSGKFIPEIDGLRFIAIFCVLVYHINGEYLKTKGKLFSGAGEGLLHNVVHTWHFGVQLFFVISGFVLGLPFVRYYCHGAAKPSLLSYYLRRLTRIEPPFVINLVLVLGLLVFVKGLPLKQLLPHFFASLFYFHNLIYHRVSDVNFVTWSLEIEAQFYLTAPLLGLLLSVGKRWGRWACFSGLTLIAAILAVRSSESIPWIGLTLLGQLSYFMVGFLVAGWFCRERQGKARPGFIWDAAAVGTWVFITMLLLNNAFYAQISLPFAVGVAYVCMFKGRLCRWLLSLPMISIVGGMCYTIYLYHPFIKSALKGTTFELRVANVYWINAGLQVFILGSSICGICAVLFILFERPFMVPHWPTNLYRGIVARFGIVRSSAAAPGLNQP